MSVPSPKREIRRFDIFAEWNHLKASKKLHLPAAEARAYGLAVAKVVASRKFSGHEPAQVNEWKRRAKADDTAEPWWHHLGSDQEFQSKIVQRMGQEFYRGVFQPAIQEAWTGGKRYEDIRDSLRTAWNVPPRGGA